jgi:hypothetical protein
MTNRSVDKVPPMRATRVVASSRIEVGSRLKVPQSDPVLAFRLVANDAQCH